MNLLELMVKIGIDDQATDKLSAIGGKFTKGLGAAAKAGAVAMTAVSGATLAFGKSAVDAGMNFDSAMSQVAATMGTTVDQIGELRDFAQEMGSTTAFSASQAAEALNYMALAGYDANTSMEMLPNVLNLAAAGGIELAAASDMVTDAQSALGLSLEQTNDLVDQMAAASSKTNTSVEQLGSAILTVGGTAKNLAGGTTELSAALGILADNGIKGAEGGTALRNVLLAMQGDKFEATFGELGVSAYDADGNLRPLEATLSDMNTVMEGMTQQEKTDLITNTFNARDLKSINALLATTGDRWDEVTEAIQNSEGAAQDMANTQLDNLAGDITLLQSALEGFQIAISDGVTPSLREFVQFGSSALQQLTDSFKEGGIDGMVETFGQLVEQGINKINEGLPTFLETGARIIGAIVSGLISAAPSVLRSMYDVARNLIATVRENLPQMMEAAGEFVMGMGSAIAENGPQILADMAGLLLDLVAYVIEHAPEMLAAAGELMLQLVSGIANGIAPAIGALNSGVQNLLKSVSSKAGAMASAAGRFVASIPSKIREAASRAVSAAGEMVSRIVSKVREIPGKAASALSGIGSTLVSAGKSLIQGFIDGISSMIGSIQSKLSSVTSMLPSWKGPEVVDRKILFGSGQLIMEGLIGGIASKEGALEAQLRGITAGIGGFSPTLASADGFAGYGGDVYNVYMSVNASDGENQMALSFARALETVNMMGGRSTAAVNVRMA